MRFKCWTLGTSLSLNEHLFDLIPIQRDFIFNPAQYSGYYGGVGNGKSTAGCMRAHLLSQMYPGNRGLIGRMTYPELWNTTEKDFLDIAKRLNGGTLAPGPYIKHFDKVKNTLTIYNDSEIIFSYLANFEAVASMNLGWWYIDQAEFIPEETYDWLETRLRYWAGARLERYIKENDNPKLLPTHHGFITGNPHPGWVYRRYKMDRTGQYKLFEAPTSANKANLPEGYEAGLRQRYSPVFIQRMLEGDWSVFQGQILTEFDARVHMIEEFKPPQYWLRFNGMDPGTTNPTAFIGTCIDTDGNMVVHHEHYQVSPILKAHADSIKALCAEDNTPRSPDGKHILSYMDPAVAGAKHPDNGRDFRELYLDFGIAGLTADKHVGAGIGKMQWLLHPDPEHKFPDWHPRAGQLGSPRVFFMGARCPNLIREIPLYEWEKRKGNENKNETEKPRKWMDHAIDAWRYAVMAAYGKSEKPLESKPQTYHEMVMRQMMDWSSFASPGLQSDPALRADVW